MTITAPIISGRQIVYTNETPFETDVLNTNLYKMNEMAMLAQTVLGGAGTSNATLVQGLVATQDTVPDLTILIGAGVMYNLQQMDATAYGVLPLNTLPIYKSYCQMGTTQVSGFTAPGAGTTNWLVQATFNTADVNVTSRPFFNATTPTSPIYSNVANTRYDSIFYSLKSAVSPAIPTPDAGYVGLYVVAIDSGETAILNADISVYSGAPFVTESLTQKISQTTADARYARIVSLQNQSYIYNNDGGSANVYTVTLSPAVTPLVAGLRVTVLIANSNTTVSTLQVNATAAKAIQVNGHALSGGELKVGMFADFEYDGTQFQLQNPWFASNTQALAGTDLTHAVTSAALASQTSVIANGYFTLPGGVIVQYGASTGTVTHGSHQVINLPITFPNAIFTVYASISPSGDGQVDACGAVATSTSQVTVYNTSSANDLIIYFLAIGN